MAAKLFQLVTTYINAGQIYLTVLCLCEQLCCCNGTNAYIFCPANMLHAADDGDAACLYLLDALLKCLQVKDILCIYFESLFS